MKILVAYPGGKDSQATLIWAVNSYGAKTVRAVFCDTGHEHELTYKHIRETCTQLGVELVILKNTKYTDLFDLAVKKTRFPSTKKRFCTEKLKAEPFIDLILSLQTDVLIFQGIRADESESRSKMLPGCTYFRYYFQPYGVDKKGKKKFHTYRKKDVFAFCDKGYLHEIFRPVFDWTAQQVINYILENGQKPNPLYYQGFSRVGCFPCIMCRHGEIKNIMERYPERFELLKQKEKEIGSTFFPPNYIPRHARQNPKIVTLDDVEKYIKGKNETLDVFDEGPVDRCMSYYHICE